MLQVPLPPELVRQAREFTDGTRTPVEPRDAATVVLMRPSEEGPSVYLLRRQTSMASVSRFDRTTRHDPASMERSKWCSTWLVRGCRGPRNCIA